VGKTGVRTIGQETMRLCSGIRFYYLIAYNFGNEAFYIEKQEAPPNGMYCKLKAIFKSRSGRT
jgi:hypothetical protein